MGAGIPGSPAGTARVARPSPGCYHAPTMDEKLREYFAGDELAELLGIKTLSAGEGKAAALLELGACRALDLAETKTSREEKIGED